MVKKTEENDDSQEQRVKELERGQKLGCPVWCFVLFTLLYPATSAATRFRKNAYVLWSVTDEVIGLNV